MEEGRQNQQVSASDTRAARAVYATVKLLIRSVLFRLFSLVARGSENLDIDGPIIVAPVHRSNLDAPLIAGLTRHRLKALAKESLFSPAPVGWFMSALGGFPVDRAAADREALRAAQQLLDEGEAVIVFPEGSRQTGNKVADVYDGAAFLAARTGAPVVPIGIAGTEEAMPPGAKLPRRAKVAIVVGEPMAAPTSEGKRVTLSQRREFTTELADRLQDCLDEAILESEQL
ncbi:MAG: lysophospholipid acyltransferase family protein [Acidimicrobiales bacterium]